MKNIEEFLPEVAVALSSTSYFSNPDGGLDPALFDGETLRPEVRQWVLNTLYGCWMKHFQHVHNWAHVWIAGSGVSYQWRAAREPGDLDILVGVDYPKFRRSNPSYAGFSDAEVSEQLNDISRAELYPATAGASINGHTYEATWYVNDGATDIGAIHPYAAYDVTRGGWTVHPQQALRATHRADLDLRASADRERAESIVASYTAALQKLRIVKGQAQVTNARSWLTAAALDAERLFDEIHTGRRAAFSQEGGGYSDPANYRWQAAKESGVIGALGAIKTGIRQYEKHRDTQMYGSPLDAAGKLLRRAMTYRSGR